MLLLRNYAACRGAHGTTNAKLASFRGSGRWREVSLFGVRDTHPPGLEGGDRRLNSEPLTPDDLRGPAGDRIACWMRRRSRLVDRSRTSRSTGGCGAGVIAASQVGAFSRAVSAKATGRTC
jgi:hypothetical protein